MAGVDPRLTQRAAAPIIKYMGRIVYDEIPRRVGITPTLPVFSVWERVMEAYMPDHMQQDEIDAGLARYGGTAAALGMAVHYWRVLGDASGD